MFWASWLSKDRDLIPSRAERKYAMHCQHMDRLMLLELIVYLAGHAGGIEASQGKRAKSRLDRLGLLASHVLLAIACLDPIRIRSEGESQPLSAGQE